MINIRTFSILSSFITIAYSFYGIRNRSKYECFEVSKHGVILGKYFRVSIEILIKLISQ